MLVQILGQYDVIFYRQYKKLREDNLVIFETIVPELQTIWQIFSSIILFPKLISINKIRKIK